MKSSWVKGDKVKMTKEAKERLSSVDSGQHVEEFGECIGIVEGPVDYGHGDEGPEVDVRWQPSNLRYAYHPDSLEAAEPPTELTVIDGSTWKNKKNGRLYTIIHGDGTNSTNAQDGQVMVTYRRHPTEVPDGGRWYHREIREFVQKFELVEEES